MHTIFFYGLFMGVSLLVDMGFDPSPLGPAVLKGYRIHIAERATLLPSAKHHAYGILMEMPADELRRLYSEESVRDYVGERVRVERLDNGQAADAHCYNLPADAVGKGSNAVYAASLSKLVDSLGFGAEYVAEIERFG